MSMPDVARNEHLQAQLLYWVQLLQAILIYFYNILAGTAPSYVHLFFFTINLA